MGLAVTNAAAALYGFFSSFGIPAYSRNNIPDNVTMPYITYDVTIPEPLSTTLIHASVFYRGTSFTEILQKCDQIEAAIGTGITLPTPGGFIALFRDDRTPFAQEQPDPEKNVRAMYLTMILHANTV